ncbi:MAG TPA: hypothetical protein VNJ06_00055 [Gemmatimonadales bacterium]|nr:hypothetical protein [Gemmatimonadales bacterium]
MDLGTLGGNVSQATSLNDSDQVAGWSQTGDGFPPPSHAFLWSHGSMQDLGTLGGCCSRADAINLAGQVAGTSTTASGEWHAFLWTAGQMQDLGPAFRDPTALVYLNDAGEVAWTAGTSGAPGHAMRWSGGAAQDLGTLGGDASLVRGINQAGAVAGHSDAPTRAHQDAFLWTPATGMVDLGNLGDQMATGGLNARGEVVGQCIINPASPSYRAWLWDGSQLVDLGALSSLSTSGFGFRVNNRGQVLLRDALWDRGTFTGPLGLSGATLNQRGIVAGQVSIAREVDHAAVWQDGQVTDLGVPNTLGDPVSSFPAAINAAADVAGWFGDPQFDGARHAALWRRAQ